MASSKKFQNIYRWDIDKTYLTSEFQSVRDIIKTALEKPEEKENIPGTVTLLKELRHGPGKDNQKNPIYFISASPEQMRQKLLEKVQLDGIECDGIILKDQMSHVRRMRFGRLRRHIGYKLGALIQSRASLGSNTPEIMFGDDTESDSTIYSLYSDVVSRRLAGKELKELLAALGVYEDEIEQIFKRLEPLPIHDPVERIYINLERKSDPEKFEKYGPKLIPTSNSFQAALHLYAKGKISFQGLIKVGGEMHQRYGVTIQTLGNALADLFDRGLLTKREIKSLIPRLIKAQLIPKLAPLSIPSISIFRRIGRWFKRTWRKLFPHRKRLSVPPTHPAVKYLDDISSK